LTFLNRSIHHIEPQTKDENVFGPEPFRDPEYSPEAVPVAASKLVGSELTPADYAALEARWIDRGLVDCAQRRPSFLALGVSGVYNWRGTIGKAVRPDGSRLDVKGAIPDLDWIVWESRPVVIAYDADAVTKEFVRTARLGVERAPARPGRPGRLPGVGRRQGQRNR
jgi:hypothetical protein